MHRSKSPASSESRAQIFLQLATLEKSGIASEQALKIVRQGASSRDWPMLESTLRHLDQRLPLAEAGRKAGLFAPWEASMVAAGSDSGRLEDLYQLLARHHERMATQSRQFKTRMTLPLAVIVLALFVTPLPALVRGELGALGYLLGTVGLLGGGMLIWRHMGQRWRAAAARGDPAPGGRLMARLPWLGKLWQQQAQSQGLAVLSLLLEAGLPLQRALRQTAPALADSALRERCLLASNLAGNGHSPELVLSQSGLCDDATSLGVVRSGSFSGSLAESLRHRLVLLDQDIQLQMALVAEWLPRILYFGAALLLMF